MGKLENNIKRKFDAAAVPLTPDAWSSFEKKWDQVQMSDLLFTQKVVNTMEFSMVPYAPNSWGKMEKQLDQIALEKAFKDKLETAVYSAPVVGWDALSEKLSEANLSSFEKGLKSKLVSGSVAYNPTHWNAIKGKLGTSKKIKFAWITSAVVLIAGLYFWSPSQQDQLVNGMEVKKESISDSNPAELTVENQKNSEFKATVSKPTTETKVRAVNSEELSVVTGEKITLEEDKVKKTGELIALLNNNKQERATEFLAFTLLSKKQNGSDQGNYSEHHQLDADHGLQVVAIQAAQQQLGQSIPELEKTKTRVDANTVAAESKIHIGLSPWLQFWDNPAVTGMYGNHQVSALVDQEWKSYQSYGENVGFKWNQPLIAKIGYDRKIANSPFALGAYVAQEIDENWNRGVLNLSGSYQKSIQTNVLDVGLSVNYLHNQLQKDGLLFKEQNLSNGNHLVTEKKLETVDVPAQQSLMLNIGMMWRSKHYFIVYNALSPLSIDIKGSSAATLEHNAIVGVHLPIQKLKTTALLKTERSVEFYFSPGIAISYNNHWFFTSEYEQLERFTFSLGRQFNNGFRAHISYGAVRKRDLEFYIRDVYSQRGHLGLSLNYLIK